MSVQHDWSKRNNLRGAVAFAVLAAGVGLCAGMAAGQTPGNAPAGTGQKAPVAASRKTSTRAFAGPQVGQQTYASAEEAAKGLLAALQSEDQVILLKVLGPNAKDIVSSGDDVADKDERKQIAQKYQQMHRLVMEPDGMTTLYVGAENWPTPIPIVHKAQWYVDNAAGKQQMWYFDSAAGKQQILYRRIGRNELAVIQVCSELVDAQKEYYGQAHDGASAHRYAEKFWSDPGKQNGLYWKADAGQPESPVGPLIARAVGQGYAEDPSQGPQPFEGYYFHMLKASGPSRARSVSQSSSGEGASAGFAFVAYPAKYRDSGVMTFLVDQDGIVYEKDLGSRSGELAKSMTVYRRDATWRKAD